MSFASWLWPGSSPSPIVIPSPKRATFNGIQCWNGAHKRGPASWLCLTKTFSRTKWRLLHYTHDTVRVWNVFWLPIGAKMPSNAGWLKLNGGRPKMSAGRSDMNAGPQRRHAGWFKMIANTGRLYMPSLARLLRAVTLTSPRPRRLHLPTSWPGGIWCRLTNKSCQCTTFKTKQRNKCPINNLPITECHI